MIAAVILAAGESKRMGRPKMLLPWGATTVLGQVLSTYQAAGIDEILVVTGGAHEKVTAVVKPFRVRTVFNTDFSSGEMLSSLQCGLRALQAGEDEVEAALVGLGDQPQVQAGTVRSICETFRDEGSKLIVPSFQRRRGHPWLVKRSLWDRLLDMDPSETPRDFLNRYADRIRYLEVSTPSILADLDTPEDYRSSHPSAPTT